MLINPKTLPAKSKTHRGRHNNYTSYKNKQQTIMKTKTMFINTENATIFVDGSGNLLVINTGGQSAGEGGMGSSSDSDTSKGDLADEGERSGVKKGPEEDDKWDPLGDNIKEKERNNPGND